MSGRILSIGEDAAAREFAESLLRPLCANDPDAATAWALAVIGHAARFLSGYAARGPEISAALQDLADDLSMGCKPRREIV